MVGGKPQTDINCFNWKIFFKVSAKIRDAFLAFNYLSSDNYDFSKPLSFVTKFNCFETNKKSYELWIKRNNLRVKSGYPFTYRLFTNGFSF